MLHSVLIHEHGRWRIEQVAPQPVLHVNHDACTWHELRDGDSLQIAAFEFLFSVERDPLTTASTEGASRSSSGSAPAKREDLCDLSASALVDCIADQVELIHHLEYGPARAARNLLRTLRRQNQRLSVRRAA